MLRKLLRGADEIARGYLGFSVAAAAVLVLVVAALGALMGVLLPVYQATGFARLPEYKSVDRPASLHFQVYKRMAAAQGTKVALRAYLTARGEADAPAAVLLLQAASNSEFWARNVAPALSITRQDQRRYGELREVATVLTGLSLRVDASNATLANEAFELLHRYVASSWLREELAAWVFASRVQIIARDSEIRVRILRAQFDIEMAEQRVLDLRGIVARHPAAVADAAIRSRVARKQEEDERLLPPVLQLVAAESAISAHRETVVRMQREARQVELLVPYFTDAARLVEQHRDGFALLAALERQLQSRFPPAVTNEHWGAEVALRLRGELDEQAEAGRQVAAPVTAQVAAVAERLPQRLGMLGVLAGFGLLLCIAVLRTMHERVAR